jgi:hypothetical protein
MYRGILLFFKAFIWTLVLVEIESDGLSEVLTELILNLRKTTLVHAWSRIKLVSSIRMNFLTKLIRLCLNTLQLFDDHNLSPILLCNWSQKITLVLALRASQLEATCCFAHNILICLIASFKSVKCASHWSKYTIFFCVFFWSHWYRPKWFLLH